MVCNQTECDCTGIKGDRGDIGPPGIPGGQGEYGEDGPVGRPGRPGEAGDIGDRGDYGDKGTHVRTRQTLSQHNMYLHYVVFRKIYSCIYSLTTILILFSGHRWTIRAKRRHWTASMNRLSCNQCLVYLTLIK